YVCREGIVLKTRVCESGPAGTFSHEGGASCTDCYTTRFLCRLCLVLLPAQLVLLIQPRTLRVVSLLNRSQRVTGVNVFSAHRHAFVALTNSVYIIGRGWY